MCRKEKIDLHMHTTVSDGSDTPEEIIGRVRDAGITVFAVTDHDAVKGCRIIRACLKQGDPEFINGVEFSCKDGFEKYHILGYGFDPETEAIQSLVEKGHRFRMKKVMARLDFLEKEFGFVFPEDSIRNLLAMDNPGKPHIGKLMVKLGFAKTKEEAILDYINRLKFKTEYLHPEEAVRGILKAGGVPVLAHPFFGSGSQMIVDDEMVNRLKRLTGFGLEGVEAFYSGFSPDLIKQMLEYADRFGLYVTAGSDYHGKNKPVSLGDTKMDQDTPPVPGMVSFLNRVRTLA